MRILHTGRSPLFTHVTLWLILPATEDAAPRYLHINKRPLNTCDSWVVPVEGCGRHKKFPVQIVQSKLRPPDTRWIIVGWWHSAGHSSRLLALCYLSPLTSNSLSICGEPFLSSSSSSSVAVAGGTKERLLLSVLLAGLCWVAEEENETV